MGKNKPIVFDKEFTERLKKTSDSIARMNRGELSGKSEGPNIVAAFSKGAENQEKVRSEQTGTIRAVSGQDTDSIRAVSGQDTDSKRAASGQDKGSKILLNGQHPGSITKRAGNGQYLILPKQQQKIYEWFLRRGLKGIFNKPLIQEQTGLPYGTIRKAFEKFIDIELLKVEYDRCAKSFVYEINPDIRVETGSIRAASGQDDTARILPSLIEEEDNLYNLLLNKFKILYPALDKIGFESSQLKEVFEIWQARGIDCTRISVALERADYAVANKTIQMDNPLDYVYRALLRGMFARPPKFKSQAELAAEEVTREEMAAVSAKLKGKIQGGESPLERNTG
jgi:hypothetical protein